MIRRACYLALFLALSCNLFVGLADAASFDCKQAKRPSEKLICSNPELSKLDEELDRVYKKVRTDLSEGAKKVVADGQRSWLAYWTKACSTDDKGTKLNPADTSCAVNKYEARINALLKNRFGYKGKHEIYQVERYRVTRAPEDDEFSKVTLHEIGYPQLDTEGLTDLNLEFAKRLNAWMLSKFKIHLEDYAYSDVEYRLTIESLSNNLLGMKALFSSYGHGRAHGDWHETAFFFNTIAMKEIKVEEIFAGDKWVGVSARHIANALHDDKECSYSDADLDIKGLAGFVRDSRRWWFMGKGLQISFPLYTIASYVCGIPRAVVPWRMLEPYLTDFARTEINTTKK